MNQNKIAKAIQKQTIKVNNVTLALQRFMIRLRDNEYDPNRKHKVIRTILTYIPLVMMVGGIYYLGFLWGLLIGMVGYLIFSTIEKLL